MCNSIYTLYKYKWSIEPIHYAGDPNYSKLKLEKHRTEWTDNYNLILSITEQIVLFFVIFLTMAIFAIHNFVTFSYLILLHVLALSLLYSFSGTLPNPDFAVTPTHVPRPCRRTTKEPLFDVLFLHMCYSRDCCLAQDGLEAVHPCLPEVGALPTGDFFTSKFFSL